MTFPVQVDIHEPRLRITIHAHDLETAGGTIGCWSYVTSGLAFWGQKELVVTVKREARESPEDYPDDPVDYLSAVVAYAQRGTLVDAGDVTQIGAKGGLFRGHALYIAAQPLAGVDLPSPALAAVVISDDELNTVRTQGPSRVIARLGREAVHFPCPPWSDRQRVRSATPVGGDSILNRVLHARVPGLTVIYDGHNVRISCTPKGRVPLQRAMETWPADQAVALMTDIGAANGCLVWQPGLTGISAIAPPHSTGDQLAACFLLITGPADNDLRIIEDGVGLILTNESLAALRDALANGRALRLVTSSGAAITVDALDRAEDATPVALLFPVEELPTRGLDEATLGGYVTRLIDVIHRARHESRLTATVDVFVVVRGQAARVWNVASDLRQELEMVAPPPADPGPVAFVLCGRQGGDDQPFDPLRQLPDEWKAAASAAETAAPGQPVSIDEIISRAWP